MKDPTKLVWGTCAGLILLAKDADQMKNGGQDLLGVLDVKVTRNAFVGKQLGSFHTKLNLVFDEKSGIFFRNLMSAF